MQLIIVLTSGVTKNLEIPNTNYTVKRLKNEIQNLYQVSFKEYNLVYDSIILDSKKDNHLLNQYGIEDGAMVHVMPGKSDIFKVFEKIFNSGKISSKSKSSYSY